MPLKSVAAAYAAAAAAAKQPKIVIKGERRGEAYTTVLTLSEGTVSR